VLFHSIVFIFSKCLDHEKEMFVKNIYLQYP